MTLLDIIKEGIKSTGSSLNDPLSQTYEQLTADDVYGDYAVRSIGAINRGLQRAYRLEALNLKTTRLDEVSGDGGYLYDISSITDCGKAKAVIAGGRKLKYDEVGDYILTAEPATHLIYLPLAVYIKADDVDKTIDELQIDRHIAVALPLYLKYELSQQDSPELAVKALSDYDAAIGGNAEKQSGDAVNTMGSTVYRADTINRALLNAGQTVTVQREYADLTELEKLGVNKQVISLIPLFANYERALLDGASNAGALYNEFVLSVRNLQEESPQPSVDTVYKINT